MCLNTEKGHSSAKKFAERSEGIDFARQSALSPIICDLGRDATQGLIGCYRLLTAPARFGIYSCAMRGNGTRSYPHVENPVCPGCGGTRFSKLGEYVTKVLEKIPGRLKVIRHIRPKLSCRCCERIMQARMPDPRRSPQYQWYSRTLAAVPWLRPPPGYVVSDFR